MAKHISTARIMELLDDPEFHMLAAESPWAFQAELDAVNDFLRATTPTLSPELLAAQPVETRIVGQRTKRVDDPGRITGQAIYSSDLHLPGQLQTAILRSPYGHAIVDDIDTSAAEAIPGVAAVVTFKNVPKLRIGGPPDQFILNQEVHFAGEEIAAVAAEDMHTALEAIRAIKVNWRVLPNITDPEAALKPDAPDLLAGSKGGGTAGFAEETPTAKESGAQSGQPKRNRSEQVYPLTKRGDFESAYASAPIKHEGVFTTGTLQHATMEPRMAVARWDGPEHLTVWASTSYVLGIRSELAALFNLPRSHVRVICDYMGGSFGDKSSGGRHARLAAVLAQMTQRPVKVSYDRPGNFKAATHRFATRVSFKAAATQDGQLVAYAVDALSDAGGYDAFSLPDLMVSLVRTYHVENALFQHASVITNRSPSGYLRCVGNPQGTFAQEVFMDELAEKVGINPLDFRLKNVETQGDQDRKLPWASCGIVECLQRGADRIGWSKKWHAPGASIKGSKAHGIGLSAHACAHGSMTMPMTAMMKIDQDGSLDVIVPSTEIGAGQATTMMMIGAETVGVKLSQAHPSFNDTAFTPDSSSSSGSRQTISAGSAVRNAGLDLKQQLLLQAVKPLPPKNEPLLSAKPEDLDTGDGFVFVKADPSKRVAIADVVKSTGGPMMGRGAHTIPPGIGMSTFAAGFAEVEVDTDTGTVTLLSYVGSNDVGRAVNPLGVEQQMHGGISMGVGMALGEDMKYDGPNGFPVIWNWENYAMPTTLDMPPTDAFDTIIVEPGDKVGPYGAKGVGEPPTSPPAPAIANAIYNAIGVRIHETPITRDKILAALAARRAGQASGR